MERSFVIWKFTIDPYDPVVRIPSYRRLLTVQAQGEQICLWAEVDPDTPLRDLRLKLYGTGHPTHPVPEPYLGTVQLLGGSLVLHIFQAVEGLT